MVITRTIVTKAKSVAESDWDMCDRHDKRVNDFCREEKISKTNVICINHTHKNDTMYTTISYSRPAKNVKS